MKNYILWEQSKAPECDKEKYIWIDDGVYKIWDGLSWVAINGANKKIDKSALPDDIVYSSKLTEALSELDKTNLPEDVVYEEDLEEAISNIDKSNLPSDIVYGSDLADAINKIDMLYSKIIHIYLNLEDALLVPDTPKGGRYNRSLDVLEGNITSTISDGTTRPWNTIYQNVEGKYCWYSFGTFLSNGSLIGSWSQPILMALGRDGIDGTDGKDGVDGSDGVSVNKLIRYYKASNLESGVLAPDINKDPISENWIIDSESIYAQVSKDKPYLWAFDRITYSNGNIYQTQPIIVRNYLNLSEIADEVKKDVEEQQNELKKRLDSITDPSYADVETDDKKGLVQILTSYMDDNQKSFADIIVSAAEASVKQIVGSEVDGIITGVSQELDGLAGLARTLVTQGNEFSEVKQQSDKIWQAVSDGDGNVAAAIQILGGKDVPGGKIILTANQIELDGQVIANAIDAKRLEICKGKVILDENGLQATNAIIQGNVTASSGSITGELLIKSSGVFKTESYDDNGGITINSTRIDLLGPAFKLDGPLGDRSIRNFCSITNEGIEFREYVHTYGNVIKLTSQGISIDDVIGKWIPMQIVTSLPENPNSRTLYFVTG